MSEWVGIDLFSGAGGMSLGATAAGIEVVAAVEICPHASSTYALNFPDVKIHNQDVQTFRSWKKPKHSHQRTIVFGGPPCQGFSTSNQRTRCASNPRNHLIFSFVEAVAFYEPDVCVMENVKGILETEHAFFLDGAIQSLTDLGYKTRTFVLNAADYGVPQRRTRVFVVGSRTTLPSTIPAPLGKPPTVWEAIHDLPTLVNGASTDLLPYRSIPESEYAESLRTKEENVSGNLVTRNNSVVIERYTHIPPGRNWEAIPDSLMSTYSDRRKCHTGIYRRLQPSEPSVVIGNYRKNMLIHPTEHRGLSVREAARIQSVPDWFRFRGSIGFQQQQVGNMVPPLLAQAVFASILEVDR